MRQPVVAGNWKMHGDRARCAALIDGIVAGIDSAGPVELVVCPPAVLIPHVASRLAGVRVGLGGQNLSEHAEGAYTGEVSAAMLADAGCGWCIVGHSERRSLYGEDSDTVAAKFDAARGSGLTAIVCVGESLEERENGQTEAVIAAQLDAIVARAGPEALAQAVIAYEPVWAIGTGRTASPEQAQDAHRFIRERLAGWNRQVADGVRILYGGSVKPDNAGALFAGPDIDGGLIGGASLDAGQFMAIAASWPSDTE